MIPEPTLDISIVIPVHNEAESLPGLHAELDAVLNALGQSYEIIAVDDGSRDDSLQVLKQLAEADPHVVVISLRRNFGQTAAFAAGFDQARGAIVITIDADGQNDPADIPLLLDQTGRRLRHRLGLAAKSQRTAVDAPDSVARGQRHHHQQHRHLPARFRLLAQSLRLGSDQAREPVRRHAPLHSGLCVVDGREGGRSAGERSRAQIRQEPCRFLAHLPRLSRSVHADFPAEFSGQAHAPVWRHGRHHQRRSAG